jgi:hypothetical protein
LILVPFGKPLKTVGLALSLMVNSGSGSTASVTVSW